MCKGPGKTRHANLMNERAENRQLELPTVPKLFAASRTQKCANTEERACHGSEKDIPFPADKITDINKKLGRRGKFGAKISENFAEDRDNSHDQESGDGKDRKSTRLNSSHTVISYAV